MTTAILERIASSDLRALHSVYVAVYRAHRGAPDLFTLGHCTTIITALMSGQPWSWRVVGITPLALQRYKEQDFKHRSKQGFTRAHLRPRIETVQQLLAPEQPMSQMVFIETHLRYDATVICVKGQNTNPGPKYIPFVNDDAALFPSKKVSWSHSTKEHAFLRDLYDASRHHLVEHQEQIEKVTRGDGSELKRETIRVRKKVRGAWNEGQTMTLHGVEVRGITYHSTWDAWTQLKIGTRAECIDFRKHLKLTKNGRATYIKSATGETFDFTLIPFVSARARDISLPR